MQNVVLFNITVFQNYGYIEIRNFKRLPINLYTNGINKRCALFVHFYVKEQLKTIIKPANVCSKVNGTGAKILNMLNHTKINLQTWFLQETGAIVERYSSFTLIYIAWCIF